MNFGTRAFTSSYQNCGEQACGGGGGWWIVWQGIVFGM